MAGFDVVKTILFKFDGDSGDLSGASDKAAGSMDGAAASSSKLSGALNVAKGAAIGAGIAAAGMAAKWAIDGIAMAETAEVLEDSFNKTFGDAAQGMLDRNEELRKAMGLSEAEFMKQTTAIGAVGIALHQTEEDAASFAEDMLMVAGDVAAFRGDVGESDEVLESMNSALQGNTQSLEKYGIEVTAAMVTQRALADSGKEAESELTQLERREASMALITEQAALMTGALNEQMDTSAVKANKMDAGMADLQTEVGGALVPLKELVWNVLGALVPILELLTPLIELLTQAVQGVVVVLQPVIDGLSIIVRWLVDLIQGLDGAFSSFDKVRDMLWRLGNQIRSTFSMSMPSWMGNIPGFHSGGTVPGSPGSEQLIRAQGGERVMTQGNAARSDMMSGGGGGGMVVNVTVQAGVGDPMEIGRQLTTILDQYARNNGATS